MKKFILPLIIVIILIVGASYWYINNQSKNNTSPTQPIPSTTGSQQSGTQNQIIFPSGGETLTQDETYTLQWIENGGKTLQIFLNSSALASQGTSVSIVDRKYNIPNTGQYSYTIPQNIPDGQYTFTIGTLTSKPFTIASSNTTVSYCLPANLQASLALQGAAGSIYGTVTLKNISSTTCQIIGNNFIKPNYDATIKNISVVHQGQVEKQMFQLQPNQTVYSQVHYPNGPQCSGQTQPESVTFSYQISASDTVVFKNQNGATTQTVQACQSPTDITKIDIWNMSDQPITP